LRVGQMNWRASALLNQHPRKEDLAFIPRINLVLFSPNSVLKIEDD